MDDALGVRVREGRRELLRDPHRLGDRKLLLTPQSRAQRLALDVRHDVVQAGAALATLGNPGTRFTRIEQRQNVWMLQPRRYPDLGEETFGPEPGAELRVQHLDRDPPLVLEVDREIHGCHAAAPELALDAVLRRDRVREGPDVAQVRLMGRRHHRPVSPSSLTPNVSAASAANETQDSARTRLNGASKDAIRLVTCHVA